MSLALVRHLCRTARHASLPVVVHHPQPTPLTRAYASKSKPKGIDTASFVPGSQQRFDSDETRTEYASAEDRMSTAVCWFRKEVAALETRATGRVTPALLAPVRVERSSGGGKSRTGTESVKLEEVATVGVKDGSVLIVTVFDEHNTKAVEQAIYGAKLPNLVPQRMDARTIKIPIPKPTVEARNALVVTASRMAEDVRVQIRKHHQTSVKKGKYEKRSVELDEFQKLSDKHVAEVDKILTQMKKGTGSK
ncbi:Ribosome recycling factor domain containing protein [Tylopilus felleus]